ncbi:unnamed protein product, partial [Iphiclides podalirius]
MWVLRGPSRRAGRARSRAPLRRRGRRQRNYLRSAIRMRTFTAKILLRAKILIHSCSNMAAAVPAPQTAVPVTCVTHTGARANTDGGRRDTDAALMPL